MRKNKAEEIIPEVIRRISRGEALSTKEISKHYGVPNNSFNDKFKPVRDNFYEHFIHEDKSSYKWVRSEASFLNKMLLTPEEAVVLTALKRNSKMYGDKLSTTIDNMVDNYVKRTKESVFKQDVLEKIDEDLEIVFAQLKYAIEEKRKIKFKNKDRNIVFYPYKIINLEYYWYILGFEEYSEYWMEVKNKPEHSQKIKTFIIAHMRGLEILDDTFTYDFSQTEQELKHAMNAFFDVGATVETIELLVVDWLEDYITRAPYFSGWKKTGETMDLHDHNDPEKIVKYLVYEIKSTNWQHMDIIPTILKYIPWIRIKSNVQVTNSLLDAIEIFVNAHGREFK